MNFTKKQSQTQPAAPVATAAPAAAATVPQATTGAGFASVAMGAGITLERATEMQKTAEKGAHKVELIKAYGNKSNAIRGLASLGLKTGPISKLLDIRFQHARNVLTRPLKRVIKDERDQKAGAAQAPASGVSNQKAA